MCEKKQQLIEEVNIMPAIEVIEYERVAYVEEMEKYLYELKNMNKKEAEKKSRENLVKSEIITENGNFTERYKFTRILQKKV